MKRAGHGRPFPAAVGQFNHGVADLNLGVRNRSVGHWIARNFLGIKDLLHELNQLGCSAHMQVRDHAVKALWLVAGLVFHNYLLFFSSWFSRSIGAQIHHSALWQTASMLYPSGSRTNAP